MKFDDFLLSIQKECLNVVDCCRGVQTENSICYDENFSLKLKSPEEDNSITNELNKQSTVIRSDINIIQARLFDILTVRIVNANTTLTQMYYDHQNIENYLKGLDRCTGMMYSVVFPVENLEQFRELQQKLIHGKIDPSAKVILPSKNSFLTILPPFSKILVKAHFFQEEKRNMFYQKVTKTFKVLEQ